MLAPVDMLGLKTTAGIRDSWRQAHGTQDGNLFYQRVVEAALGPVILKTTSIRTRVLDLVRCWNPRSASVLEAALGPVI